MELSIFFAGTGGSSPTARRGLPATVVRCGGEWNLVDCGEGTQRQLISTIGLGDIERIFITHFHLDHWLGLPGMLKSFDLRDRDRPLTVYGPPGARRVLGGVVDSLVGRTGYDLRYEELGPHEEVRGTGLRRGGLPGRAPRRAVPRLRGDRGRPPRGASIPSARWPWAWSRARTSGACSVGRRWPASRPDQVVDAERPGRRVVISGDTGPCDGVLAAAYEADVLVHEATFLDVDRARARETGHSTAREAGELARRGARRPARADALLDPLPRPRAARRGARGLRADRGAARLRRHRRPVPGARRAPAHALGAAGVLTGPPVATPLRSAPAALPSTAAARLPAAVPLTRSREARKAPWKTGKVVLDRDDMRRTLVRIAHEIVEHNPGRRSRSSASTLAARCSPPGCTASSAT